MTTTTSTVNAAPERTRTGPTAGDVKISDLSNDSLVIRLLFTINHLSRWLTPIHDLRRLERSPYRGQPSVKELLIAMRDYEQRIFPKLHAMAVRNDPDLDQLPEPVVTEEQRQSDQRRSVLTQLAEFRRLRQSTCSLLRALPDSAWSRVGTSRREHDWQIRSLAEHLANHDLTMLREIEAALERSGARENVNSAAKTPLDELLRLVPVSLKPQD
jgi:hypothetical protein